MKPKMVINSREFKRAMKKYHSTLRRRTIPDTLNRQAPFVILSAMKRTTKTLASRITSELGTMGAPTGLGIKIIRARAKARGIKLNRKQMLGAFNRMLAARRGAVRYVSLGWLPALEGVGKKVMRPLKSGSLAAKGGGAKKASALRHEVRFWNAAPGILSAGPEALRGALAQSSALLRRFAQKNMARAARRHNVRR